ncbi:hypothetical protein NBRC116583_17000 [Arenicella sp. 4NH20-0111]|uniref:hypothetical protein n=1 Tax=Arenicella sp. 4NH20-0111 TaxID=3127648 RepID=UPI00310A95DC
MLNVKEATTFDEGFIETRARVIAYGIQARSERFPNEIHYDYFPLPTLMEECKWGAEANKGAAGLQCNESKYLKVVLSLNTVHTS